MLPLPLRRLAGTLCLTAACLCHAADPDPAAPADTAATDTAPALALPDLHVSTEKREQEAQRVPRAVTVIDRQTLDDAGVRSVSDALRLAPNTNLVEFGVRRLHFPFFRGVGAGQGAPAVTTYVDGVPQLSANTASLELLEVERIELVRGPLGTLYGRNTLGGAINIVTRQPRHDYGGSATLTVGADDLARAQVSVSGPLTHDDKLYFDLAFGFDSRDGYTHNPVTHRDVDDRDGYSGRVGLLWLPDPDFSLRLSLTGERNRDGGYVLTPLDQLRDEPHDVTQDEDGYADRDVLSPTLELRWTADRYTVTAITGLSFWDVEEVADTDFSPFPLFVRYTHEEQASVSQELRLATPDDAPWSLGDGLDLHWMIGASFLYTDFDSESYTEASPLAVFFMQSPVATRFWTDGQVETWAAGLYGQATLSIDQRWDLTVGLRYDYEHADARIHDYTTDPVIPFTAADTHADDAWDALLPHVALAYHITADLMPYISVSRGYRPGGFNLNAPPGQTPYDAESTWSYELGVKSQWLDRRLTLNLAAFYIDWDDMQLFIPDPGTGRFYVDNAGEARSYGLELETRYRVCPYTELFAGIGWTDAQFQDFDDPISGDADGKDLPFAPDLTWHAGLQQTLPICDAVEAYGRVEVTGTGSFAYDAGNSEGENGYTLTHFRAGIRGERWHLEAWLRNAFDEAYIPVAFQLAPGFFVAENGAPRTVGLSLGVTW